LVPADRAGGEVKFIDPHGVVVPVNPAYMKRLAEWDALRLAGGLERPVEFPVTANRIMSDLRIYPTKDNQAQLGVCLRFLGWRRYLEKRKGWDHIQRWLAPE
jgi:hypothetical protein